MAVCGEKARFGGGLVLSHLKRFEGVDCAKLNFTSERSVTSSSMKKVFLFAGGLIAASVLSSCSDYATYGVQSSYSSGFGSSGFYSGGYAPLSVGFIGTTYDRWAYDPFRRSYFDRRLGRYYNHFGRSYYSVAPRRYSSPRYPRGYRRGHRYKPNVFLPRGDQFNHVQRRRVLRSDSRRASKPLYYDNSVGSRGVDNRRFNDIVRRDQRRGLTDRRGDSRRSDLRRSTGRSDLRRTRGERSRSEAIRSQRQQSFRDQSRSARAQSRTISTDNRRARSASPQRAVRSTQARQSNRVVRQRNTQRGGREVRTVRR